MRYLALNSCHTDFILILFTLLVGLFGFRLVTQLKFYSIVAFVEGRRMTDLAVQQVQVGYPTQTNLELKLFPINLRDMYIFGLPQDRLRSLYELIPQIEAEHDKSEATLVAVNKLHEKGRETDKLTHPNKVILVL